MNSKANTDRRQAARVLGMPRSQYTDLKLWAAGHLGVDTWCYTLAKAVKGVGRRGDLQLFPVPHSKTEAANG